MKQSLSPAVFFSVIAVLVVVVGGLVFWMWNRPASATASGAATQSTAVNSTANMKADHTGPSADQQKQIDEWKRTHPGASTRF